MKISQAIAAVLVVACAAADMVSSESLRLGCPSGDSPTFAPTSTTPTPTTPTPTTPEPTTPAPTTPEPTTPEPTTPAPTTPVPTTPAPTTPAPTTPEPTTPEPTTPAPTTPAPTTPAPTPTSVVKLWSSSSGESRFVTNISNGKCVTFDKCFPIALGAYSISWEDALGSSSSTRIVLYADAGCTGDLLSYDASVAQEVTTGVVFRSFAKIDSNLPEPTAADIKSYTRLCAA